jgi:hypothetical protein
MAPISEPHSSHPSTTAAARRGVHRGSTPRRIGGEADVSHEHRAKAHASSPHAGTAHPLSCGEADNPGEAIGWPPARIRQFQRLVRCSPPASTQRDPGDAGKDSAGYRPTPDFKGFSACSSTAIVLPPPSSLLLTWGKLGRGSSGETSPARGRLPARSPHRLPPPRRRGDAGVRGNRAHTRVQVVRAITLARGSISGMPGGGHRRARRGVRGR